MKLRDIINNIDKTKQGYNPADVEELLSATNVPWGTITDYDYFDEHLKAYYFIQWLCTDQNVGGMIYFLDDEPIAVSTQTGRKNPVNIRFFSEDAYNKARRFMLSCTANVPANTYIDIDEEYDESYSFKISPQLVGITSGIYKGETVTFEVNEIVDYSDESVKSWPYVDVTFPNGEVHNVAVKDIVIPASTEDLPQLMLNYLTGD